jgi:hypothetical protein
MFRRRAPSAPENIHLRMCAPYADLAASMAEEHVPLFGLERSHRVHAEFTSPLSGPDPFLQPLTRLHMAFIPFSSPA